MQTQEKKRVVVRRQGLYGEKTVLRRVPLSVVPLLDFLLDRMKRQAKSDPRKTLERVASAVERIALEEQAKDDATKERFKQMTFTDAEN